MTAIPIEVSVKMFGVTRCEKSKMAASELPKCISHLVHMKATTFHRLYHCFRGPTIKKIIVMFNGQTEETGNGTFKMAAYKLRLRISHLLHKIATKFQRYTYVFWVQLSNEDSGNVL